MPTDAEMLERLRQIGEMDNDYVMLTHDPYMLTIIWAVKRIEELEGALRPVADDIALLREYVVYHAGDHEDDCSMDDTCDCKYNARNWAVNRVCNWEYPKQVGAALSPAPAKETEEQA